MLSKLKENHQHLNMLHSILQYDSESISRMLVWLKLFPNLFLILDIKMSLFLWKLIENSAKIPSILVVSFIIVAGV